MAEFNKDNAKRVYGYWGTIEKVVEYLINCRNKGDSVYIIFNGNKLYSADVTLESAYIQITGLNKREFKSEKKEMSAAKTDEQKKAVMEKYNSIRQAHINEEKKIAKKASGYWGTIEKAVEYLIDCRNKGDSEYIIFNGKKLYSADVTLENAYLQIAEPNHEQQKEKQSISETPEGKEQLTSEISEIEQQLAVLKSKQTELKKLLKNKQAKLNELEEKLQK